jgi:threonyl-tRNA synthetase
MNKKQNELNILRHSTAHILASAVLEMFPEAKFGIGPAIENGFYYDFDLPRTLIPEDLPLLEEKMKAIINANYPFERAEISIKEAMEDFKKLKQDYKVELIKDIEKAQKTSVTSKPVQPVSVYKTGHFVDLCAGPHLDSTGEISADGFRLTKISGAYWKGSEKNKMLQRIYGVAFENKNDLDEYLKMMEEAEKRDHRKLGKELDLFMFHDVAPGMPFLLPKGMTVYLELLKFVREHSYGEGYKEVRTPQLLNSKLWKTSGHWEHFKEDMFCLHHAEDNIDIGIKPMNCPAHMLIFKRGLRSYKDLPLRIAETTTLYRNEKSGTLQGLTRVRSLSQDDTHIFCTNGQILEEINKLLEKVKNIYTVFGLEIDQVHLSTRPEKFMGEKKDWDEAEENLKKSLEKNKLKYEINEGDGAFYGPKIDIKVKDVIGRQWQLATIQLDFQMPRKFELNYIDSDGKEKTPVVIHRAILGSMERFLGIVIEHYAGAFPVWLSPVQTIILPVSEKFKDYAHSVETQFIASGIRAVVDDSDETLGKRIAEAEKQKIPYMIVVGEKEKKDDSVAVRTRGEKKPASTRGDDRSSTRGGQEVMRVDEFIKKIIKEIDEKK